MIDGLIGREETQKNTGRRWSCDDRGRDREPQGAPAATKARKGPERECGPGNALIQTSRL